MSKDLKSKERILIVEDDREHGLMLVDELEQAGYGVVLAASAEEGVALNRTYLPDVVLSDLQLPGMSGLDLLRVLQEVEIPPTVIILTAFGTIPQAVEALKAGATNFLTKPIDFDHLLISVGRACELRSLRLKLLHLESRDYGGKPFHGMYGESASMIRLFKKIQLVARAVGPVIITGESGAGKELVAQAIHAESDRQKQRFVPVNCASIPENLLESELFGHAPGAFTGATKARHGLFAEANGGILFLDEVNELSLAMQAKLLRALQEGTVRPVGANQETLVDVRVIVATNSDLEKEEAEGRFRQDLFYRLEMFQLDVPPLRLRGDDIGLLASKFLLNARREIQKNVEGFSTAAMQRLLAYSYPGNVRELQNAVTRAVAFCQASTIQAEDLPDRIGQGSPGRAGTVDVSTLLSPGEPLPSLEEMKSRYILHALKTLGGNKRRTAELLGIGRRTLYRYLGSDD